MLAVQFILHVCNDFWNSELIATVVLNIRTFLGFIVRSYEYTYSITTIFITGRVQLKTCSSATSELETYYYG